MDKPMVVQVWAGTMRQFDYMVAMEALSTWIATTNYPPKLDNLREMCEEIERQRQFTDKARAEIAQSEVGLIKKEIEDELPQDHNVAWRDFHVHWLKIFTHRAIVRWTQVSAVEPVPWEELVKGYERLSHSYPLLRIDCKRAIEELQDKLETKTEKVGVSPEMFSGPDRPSDDLPF
jgi:hypothetical protein